ncbi:unnamed protein product [Diamesa hyperborea]
MFKTASFVLVTICALFVVPGLFQVLETDITETDDIDIYDNTKRCSSLSCIHGSASILELIDPEIEPCENFYEYACGNFVEEVYTPDEKATLDTLSLMSDRLVEYLLTLFSVPISKTEPKLHQLSKTMFNSCSNSRDNDRSKEVMLEVLKQIQGFPMLDGAGWNEKNWDWKTSLLNLRKYISKKDNNIFKKKKKMAEILNKQESNGYTEEVLQKIKTSLEPLMIDVVRELGGSPTAPHLSKDIDNLIAFEETLADYFNKNLIKRNQTDPSEKVKGFTQMHKKILWMELFQQSPLKIVQKHNGTLEATFIQNYHKFIDETPKRVLANYVAWRLILSSLQFMNQEMRNALLKFQKSALGKEDVDQRWKLCALLTQSVAAVATGSLYVEGYFKEDDKKTAVSLVNTLFDEYLTTIKESTWMSNQTKIGAQYKALNMKRYIGYEDQLRGTEGAKYYDDLYEYGEDKFLEMVLAFKIFETDREYNYIYDKKGPDWSKYSKPATINAFYKSEDNSIQFPAGFLQAPNFDRERPDVMNFGAIGSVIGHEMTHAFDDLAEKQEGWTQNNTEDFMKRRQCIIDQYNNYTIDRVDQYVQIDYKTNGVLTLKENVADCGGVKLSYNAYKKWSNSNKTQIKPIGLDRFTNEQIFWLSFAQTFCSVERPIVLNNKEAQGLYALNRFRVIGPIMNMKEFAADFNCPVGAPMNPPQEKRCALCSASILELINPEIEPCDDFYDYACGNFVEEVFTPDEKAKLDTFSLMGDKLVEYLLTLFSVPIRDNDRSKEAMLEVLKQIQGFPMLDGADWNEKSYNWTEALLSLRKYISKKDNNIFLSKKETAELLSDGESSGITEDDLKNIKNNFGSLITVVIQELGGSPNASHLSKDIKDLIAFEEKLAMYFNKNARKPFETDESKRVKGFSKIHKKIFWMELFSPSYFANVRTYNEEIEEDFIKNYKAFIKGTSMRVIANYVGWRLLQTSLEFMNQEMRNAILEFEKKARGKEDVDQRWKLCALLTQKVAAVATGNLYVEGYFKEDDKKTAVSLVNTLFDEYLTTINGISWMSDQTKIVAQNKALNMTRYIGYEDELRTTVGANYYKDLYEYGEDKFLEMVLAFKIFEADRTYSIIYDKTGPDWSKYSKPATIAASYNSKDNSIQFPAGFLQAPNFDRGRPDVMNFGAIGSVIGHEMTHAFDDLAEKQEGWSEKNTKDFMNRRQCIIDQYNNYTIDRVDQYVQIDYKTNGTVTLKENVADCGGVKLSYNAYKKWSKNKTQIKPIGLDRFTNEQIFWLSFAQTYCSVERPKQGLYALNRFRVNGPIMNMEEFATDFNCPVGAQMNPPQGKRCSLW